jgi:hypothetical protein
MADNPFRLTVSENAAMGEITVTGGIDPKTKVARTYRETRPATLPNIFEDSHPWPIAWGGGKEVTQGRLFSAKDFNAGAMARAEKAGARLAEAYAEQGARIRATVAVSRYPEGELKLMNTAIYSFEVGRLEKGVWRFESLAEVSITQSLSDTQRLALSKGTPLSKPGETVLRYRLDGEVIEINTRKLAKVSGDAFGDIEALVGGAGKGWQRSTPDRRSARARDSANKEKGAIRQADKESKERTAVPEPTEAEVAEMRRTAPKTATERQREMRAAAEAQTAKQAAAQQQRTPSPTAQERGVAGSGATQADRGLGDARVGSAERGVAPPPPPAATQPSSAEIERRLASASRRAPTAAESEQLEKALSATGKTEVEAEAAGLALKIKRGEGIVAKGKMAGVAALPIVGDLVSQHLLEVQTSRSIERGTAWIEANYPQVGGMVDADQALENKADEAVQRLADNESVWGRMLAPGMPTNVAADAHARVEANLGVLHAYWNRLNQRDIRLGRARNELDVEKREVDVYISALYRLGQELEDKVLLCLVLPAGHAFGLELFQWAEFTRGIAQRVGALSGGLSQRESEYAAQMDADSQQMDVMGDVIDHWRGLMAGSEQAAGI